MVIKSIIITCPDCKKKFTSTKVVSLNTFNGSPDFNSEPFSSTRKCPDCGKLVDIADDNNWIYTLESLGRKIKDWLNKFLP